MRQILAALSIVFAAAQAHALIMDISSSDLRIQMPKGEELAVNKSYYATDEGAILAFGTNKNNYLVLKFSNDVAGYRHAVEAYERVMSYQTLILPEGAELDSHQVTLQGEDICKVKVQNRYDARSTPLCGKVPPTFLN